MTGPRTPLAPRGLYLAVRDLMASQPVVVLRGARAVGKTTLAQELTADLGGTIARLDDAATADEVRRDPVGWLRGRRGLVVLDEAQQVPELLLAVKRFVDESAGETPILLTGSVELPRELLGGADPLAGRASSLTLRPMTQVERRSIRRSSGLALPFSFADFIFGDQRGPATYSAVSDVDRRNLLARGGLPQLALGARPPAMPVIHEYVSRVIGDDLTGRFDRGLSSRLMRLMAAETSSIQNVAAVAQALGGAKHETVSRHLDRLESAFLLHRLPALRPSARGVARAHPKIHVSDSTLAVWGGASEGKMLETLVVNEIITLLSFANDGHEYQPYHWRDSKTGHEVDLVVIRDGQTAVGFEIKSAASVSDHDLAGLRALLAAGEIATGFVVYSGSSMYRLDADLWAVPVAALWESASQTRERIVMTSAPARDQISPGAGQISVFLSYVHQDDDAWAGAIVRTARDLVTMLESETGETVRLFVDRDMVWGQTWRQRLDSELSTATFLIPVVTPKYLRSEACRAELLEFSQKAAPAARAGNILPLLWTPTPDLTGNDEVAERLRAAQWEDWTTNRALGSADPSYRAELARLANRLQERLLEEIQTPQAFEDSRTDIDVDIVEVLAAVEETTQPVLDQFRSALEGWMSAFEGAPAMPANPSPKLLKKWSEGTAGVLGPHTDRLDRARADMEAVVRQVDDAMREMQRLMASNPITAQELAQGMDLGSGLDVGIDAQELAQMLGQLDMIGAFLKPLRRHILALRAAVQLIDDTQTLFAGWKDSISRVLE